MKCAHCLVEFHDDANLFDLGADRDCDWGIIQYICPNPSCKKMNLFLVGGKFGNAPKGRTVLKELTKQLIRPKGVSRTPVPMDVPEKIVAEYKEACIVLADSPKASAALGRRCLQLILRETAKVKQADLVNEIQEVIDRKDMPSYISECLDAVRIIGNFAAHPIKSKNTGEIVPVEPNEAEWNLDVLESLFDFYYVQPAKIRQKKDALSKKLQDVGKPPLK